MACPPIKTAIIIVLHHAPLINVILTEGGISWTANGYLYTIYTLKSMKRLPFFAKIERFLWHGEIYGIMLLIGFIGYSIPESQAQYSTIGSVLFVISLIFALMLPCSYGINTILLYWGQRDGEGNPSIFRGNPRPSVPISRDARILSVDAFKGWILGWMILINCISGWPITPWFVEHSRFHQEIVLTFPDLGSCGFLFVIALISQTKTQKTPAIALPALQSYYLKRYLIYIAIGLILGVEFMDGRFFFEWTVLSCIGGAGIILVCVQKYNWKIRLLFGIMLMVLYECFLHVTISGGYTLRELVLLGTHGGIVGTIGWGIIIVLQSVLAKYYIQKSIKGMVGAGIGCLSAGYGIHFAGLIPIDVPIISSSFILVCIGYTGIIFSLFWYVYDLLDPNHVESKVYKPLGKNILLLFVMNAIYVRIVKSIVPIDASFIHVLGLGLINLLFAIMIAFLFQGKYKSWKI